MEEKTFLNEMYSAALERTIRRFFVICILLIIALVGSNTWWIYNENQYETIKITQENEDGLNNYIGEEGTIYNGETDSCNSTEED